MAAESMLLLTYSEEIVDGEPIHVSSNSLPVKALNLEPAGYAFHVAALRLVGHSVEVDAKGDTDKEAPTEKERVYVESSNSYSSKGKKKTSGDERDHYALLGLGHLRYLATEEQIRKSYRETALRHHPDKQAALLLSEETESAKQAKKDEIETRFKAIQEAYEVLIDPVRRRIYDSTDEFDDEIPQDCAPQDFFKVFGPAFMRNGRWSVVQPIPALGDDNTLLKEVDSFYNFWYSFKSWREFPHADEFDLEQAESRDHRRWMERQNAKLSEKARKEENVRIRTLVDNAYKRDPRILRRREEEKAEKTRKKDAKLLVKKLQEEVAARIAEEERLRKEEEEMRAAEAALIEKKSKEKEKKLLRKERAHLRALSAPILSQHLIDLTDEHVESLCLALDKEQLRSLCDLMEGKEALESAEILRKTLESNFKLKDGKESEHNSKQNGSVAGHGEASFTSNEKRENHWCKEEIDLLRKGMVKYPKGTSRRWEVISEYIGTKRSVEEILKATKTVFLQKPNSAKAFESFLEKRKPAQAIASTLSTREDPKSVLGGSESVDPDNVPDSSLDQSGNISSSDDGGNKITNAIGSSPDEDNLWSAAQERALVQALKTFPRETSQRWERVAEAIPGKSVAHCKKKFALMKDSFRTGNANIASTTDAQPHDSSTLAGESNISMDKIEVSNGTSSSSNVDVWSEVQEKALIQALKTFPKETNQRWERVATAVPGKTVNQCKKRFTLLKESFRNKKRGV